jgi:hypothetical protein
MKRLKELGINWMAITDHNSMANCPAYEQVAQQEGLSFTWGVEIQSSEEIHLLAYFDDSEAAKSFDKELYDSLLPLENDADFFGDQVIIDENENILRVEQRALINSSMWDMSTVVKHVHAYQGFVVPAHVDAGVNSIISQLGFIPDEPEFRMFGVTSGLNIQNWVQQQPFFADKTFLRASDAHYLADLGSGFSELFLEKASASELDLLALKQAGRLIR